MAPATSKPAKLHPLAHARLGVLQTELQRQGMPRNVDMRDILSALVLYTTAPQIAGMLTEYWRYTADPAPGEEEPPSAGQP